MVIKEALKVLQKRNDLCSCRNEPQMPNYCKVCRATYALMNRYAELINSRHPAPRRSLTGRQILELLDNALGYNGIGTIWDSKFIMELEKKLDRAIVAEAEGKE